MNKQEVYSYIENRNIFYEITEHEPIFNMEDAAKLVVPYPDSEAKNIFLRDDKKKNYYLITIKGNKKVDLKLFKEKYNTRRLSFASDGDLMDILKLTPGAVTPLGLLNDDDRKVIFYLDKDFLDGNGIIGVHPNQNDAALWLRVKDLIDIIKEHGNDVYYADI